MIDLLQKQLHIFDLDDTLVVTRATYWGAQEKALAEILPAGSEELATATQKIKPLTKHFSSSFPDLYSKALFLELGRTESQARALTQQFLISYHKHYWQDIQPLADAAQTLQLLVQQNKSLALVSNGKRENQLKKLEATDLESFFPQDNIFISGDYPANFKKPAPAMVKLCLDHFQIEATDAVYYGNLITDVIAGNLAGCSTVFIELAAQEKVTTQDVQSNLQIATPSLTIQHWSQLNLGKT